MGAIASDSGGGAARDNARLKAFLADQTALGRVGEADDVGGVVASLLLPASRWVNGQRPAAGWRAGGRAGCFSDHVLMRLMSIAKTTPQGRCCRVDHSYWIDQW